jgi:cyclin-dependent kinase 7
MDFMDTDLEQIIKDQSIVFVASHIKSYLLQTLLGLEYLHINWILHRDLKPNNLLVNKAGILKIGDFGLAKAYGSPNRPYTHIVVTRWYRAPELLFGARIYSTGIDVWAVGCILAEMLLRVPLVAGDTDLDQLAKIFQALGTPTQESWPNHDKLPDYVQFKEYMATPFQDIFTAASSDLIQVLSKTLALDPMKRATCTQALQLPYFRNKPAPATGTSLPLPSSISNKNDQQSNAGNQAGRNKRKFLEDAETSGLAKKLVF